MEKPSVGINGFGRIGMGLTRANIRANYPLDIRVISDIADAESLTYLLNHDTVHGNLERTMGSRAIVQEIDSHHDIAIMRGEVREALLHVEQCSDPSWSSWRNHGVQYVIEATGKFVDNQARGHQEHGGAKCVIVSQPTNEFPSVIAGINDHDFDPSKHPVLDAASCTTHGLAPVVKVLDEEFGIEEGFMSGVHAVTNSQPVLDAVRLAEKSKRGLRAAPWNFYPYPSGAARAIGKVLPALEGKLIGDVIRVPVADVSMVELTAKLQRTVNVEDIVEVLRAAASGPLQGILRLEQEELVSSDFIGDTHDSIVDASSIMVSSSGRLARVRVFYDNEVGYSNGLLRLLSALHSKLA